MPWHAHGLREVFTRWPALPKSVPSPAMAEPAAKARAQGTGNRVGTPCVGTLAGEVGLGREEDGVRRPRGAVPVHGRPFERGTSFEEQPARFGVRGAAGAGTVGPDPCGSRLVCGKASVWLGAGIDAALAEHEKIARNFRGVRFRGGNAESIDFGDEEQQQQQ